MTAVTRSARLCALFVSAQDFVRKKEHVDATYPLVQCEMTLQLQQRWPSTHHNSEAVIIISPWSHDAISSLQLSALPCMTYDSMSTFCAWSSGVIYTFVAWLEEKISNGLCRCTLSCSLAGCAFKPRFLLSNWESRHVWHMNLDLLFALDWMVFFIY